eukprot:PITA_16145
MSNSMSKIMKNLMSTMMDWTSCTLKKKKQRIVRVNSKQSQRTNISNNNNNISSRKKKYDDQIRFETTTPPLRRSGDVIYRIDEIKQQMSQMFEMKHLSELRYCLGLDIWRDSGQTFLSQAKYVKGLLEKFRMDPCKPAPEPLHYNIKLQYEDGSKVADATLYRQLVGSLIYLTTTRPNLAYAVSVLSQFMSNPLESHWNATKNVLRYLQDSDWAGNVDDHRSITGYAFSLGSRVITWSSKKQNTVSLSLAEVEYQAMCAATCEAVWLWRLLYDVGEE